MSKLYEVEVKRCDNADKFRPAASKFEKYGYYTSAPPGTTSYLDFWDKELLRCIHGYTTEDGEFISGYFYFYLNYCRIVVTNKVKKVDRFGKTRVSIMRTESFPRFYDYDRAYFDAVEAAEQAGKHLAVIKKRGAGYSYKNASMLCRNFYCIPKSKSYAIAAETEFLSKDGILNKVTDMMSFIDSNTAFAKKRQKKDTVMHRRASFVQNDDTYGFKTERGWGSEIIGVSLKNDPQKAHPYSQEVCTPTGIQKWADIKIGSELYTPVGDITKVTEVHEFGEGDVYKITFNDGRIVYATLDHEWEISRFDRGVLKTYKVDTRELIRQLAFKTNKTNRLKIKIGEPVEFEKKDTPIDPYTLGLLLGDGSINKTTNKQAPLTMSHEDVEILKKYIPYEVRCDFWPSSPTIRNTIFIPGGRDSLKALGLFDKTAGDKFIPDIYKFSSIRDRLAIINGLLDTDGSITKDYGVIEYSSKSHRLVQDVKWMLDSLGIGSSIKYKVINNTKYYRLYIYSKFGDYRLFKLERKNSRLRLKKNNTFANNKRNYISIDSIEYSHKELVKCVTVESEDSQYYVGDFVTTFNSRGKRGKLIIWEESGKFPNLKEAWQIARPSVEDGTMAFGLLVAFGTGGSKDADYDGLKDLFYEPDAYNCLPIRNVWDEGSFNSAGGFFVPQYYNLEGTDELGVLEAGRPFMDENGNSDIVFTKKFCEVEREVVFKSSSDKTSIDRYIAERPFTPSEATLQISGNIFPKKDLIRHLADIRTNEKLSSLKQVGDLYLDSNGTVKWELDPKLKDLVVYRIPSGHSKDGAIVIWEHPPIEIPYGLYVIGVDPYDFDQSGTNSLGSCIVYKRFQGFEAVYETVVAEYTGRPNTADEFYEKVRLLSMYYSAKILYENEKKGLFDYFTRKHCEYLLADQPGIIKDIVQNSTVNRGKGIHMATPIKDWGEGAIKDWLNTEYSPGRKNLTKLYSEPLLEELIAYNSSGNFDRVMAFMLVMIYIRELHDVVVKQKKEFVAKSLFKEKLFGMGDKFNYTY